MVVLTRKVHLGRQRLGRARSQLVSRGARVHTVAVGWVALLLLRAEVIID